MYFPFRCEVPQDTSEQARLQLLVDWILSHPGAVEEVKGIPSTFPDIWDCVCVG